MGLDEEQRARGLKCSAADPQTWTEWRAAFGALSAEQKATYLHRAELSKGIAKANRESRNAAARCTGGEAPSPLPPSTLALMDEASPAATSSLTVAVLEASWPTAMVSVSSYRRDRLVSITEFCKATGLEQDGQHPLTEGVFRSHGPYKAAQHSFRNKCSF